MRLVKLQTTVNKPTPYVTTKPMSVNVQKTTWQIPKTSALQVSRNEILHVLSSAINVTSSLISFQESLYQEECNYDVQCSSVVSNTYCYFETESEEKSPGSSENRHGRCQCLEAYFHNMNSCFMKRSEKLFFFVILLKN